jgi:cation diffusion facilitator family transporter
MRADAEHMNEHTHAHAHTDDHGHTHAHTDDHGHSHSHSHTHSPGFLGAVKDFFVPHSHDPSDSIDNALEASSEGIRAVKLSLAGLGATAVLQLAVVLVSGSVALLADTVHNFSDALTAVPLWIAFAVGRRKPTRRYTHGFGRAEDLAGLFIIAMIALSAVIAAWEAVDRFVHPQTVQNLGWVLAAGLIGFAGNELVAAYRIRVGRRIGSAALVADGVHARTDGFTSLAVVAGVIGVWAGFPLADPLVGLLISAAIAVLLWGTARDIGRRLLDGVDPDLVGRAEAALRGVHGIEEVQELRLRWSGNRLEAVATVLVDGRTDVERVAGVAAEARAAVVRALPRLGHLTLSPAPAPPRKAPL